MVNTIGRPDIRQYAGQGRQRAEDNALQAAIWVFRWGWTTAQVINRVLDLQRPGLADELVKKGVLERMDAQPGWRESHVYILSQPSVERVEAHLDRECMAVAPYTLHESRRVPWSIHGHNMACQHVLLDILGARPSIRAYMTEPEYRREGAERDGVPDFGYLELSGWVDCEMELNRKEDLRLKRWLWLRVKALQARADLRLRIFTPLMSVQTNVAEILRKRSIHPVTKDSGKLWERQDQEGIELAPFRDRIEVVELQINSARRTGGLGLVELE